VTSSPDRDGTKIAAVHLEPSCHSQSLPKQSRATLNLAHSDPIATVDRDSRLSTADLPTGI